MIVRASIRARAAAHPLPLLVALLLALLAACGSPVVGLECRDGYTRCGGACYDLERDESHCGGCNLACDTGQMCIEGSCTFAWDGGPVVDAGLDAGSDAGSFPPTPPLCTGPGSPEDCVCGIGQEKCDGTCRDLGSDPEHCGACDASCGTGYCVKGLCYPTCEPPLVRCNRACVDPSDDEVNCGLCFAECASGLCVDGRCLGPTAGHIILLGHDMSSGTAASQRLFGNSVFLSLSDPVRVLVYDAEASNAARAGVSSAIANMAELTGREYTATTASALAVTFLLGSSDVFVIQAQAAADDESLQKNGETWSLALQQFVRRGGVVVLMEAASNKNLGTWQILKHAGLFDAGERVPVGSKPLDLIAPADGVATGVPTMYLGRGDTVGFGRREGTVVVAEPETETPVVIHIAR